ncbi:MAG: hypothetical protein PHP53_12450 [Prolixibacteraceae bacterium]|nr:hypothetical protein [Prolixibacteraceae bacterium]
MKQFISKLLSFVLIIIILVLIVTFINYKLINNSSFWKFPDKTRFIVFGHSHSAYAFNDSLITNMSNYSSSGEAYFYTYLKVKKIIPNNKQIKVVFIEFDNTSVDKKMDLWTWGDENIYSQFPSYFPLLTYPEFKLLWSKNSKAILNCAPQSFIKSIGYDYLKALHFEKGITSYRFGGYSYNIRDKTDSLINNLQKKPNIEKTKNEISETSITYLSKIIDLCRLNEVKVFLIRSPILYKYTGLENEQYLNELLGTKFSDYEFLDFKDFPLRNNEFGDFSHLNYRGAKKFSIFFNSLLESGFLNKPNKQHILKNKISTLTDTLNASNINLITGDNFTH